MRLPCRQPLRKNDARWSLSLEERRNKGTALGLAVPSLVANGLVPLSPAPHSLGKVKALATVVVSSASVRARDASLAAAGDPELRVRLVVEGRDPPAVAIGARPIRPVRLPSRS